MRLFAILLSVALSTGVVNAAHAEDTQLQQAHAFFDQYLGLYNQRFGHPERSEMFRKEMAALMYEPLFQVPPKGSPRVPESRQAFVAGLEAFVRQLEKLGVVRLEYDQVQLYRLSSNKVLANNRGYGYNDNGQPVYETISLYLLYRDGEKWQLAMLNAYDADKALTITQ